MERMDPFVTNIVNQINDLNSRIETLEGTLSQPQVETKPELLIPKTQGRNRKREVVDDG